MQIHDAKTALDYIHGGNAIFTVVSKLTGNRYTYRARKSSDNGEILFIDLLTGPDNKSDYMYLGHYWSHDEKGMDGGKKGQPNHPAFAALDWLVICLVLGRMPSTAEFWHEGKCARCGRKLTTPESIETGFGPECIKKAIT